MVIAVLLFAPPLVLRGPVLRWVFSRTFASRCGHFAIRGGHFGWASVPRLAAGRPISVTVEDLAITGPDDRTVLAAKRIDLAVALGLAPLRIGVTDATVAEGQWRFASDGEGRGSSDAFLPLPAQGRAACGVAQPSAPAGEPSRARFALERGRMIAMDVDLDFPEWRLALSRVNTSFGLGVGAENGFTFDFGHVEANSASLRVGAVGSPWTTSVPFDAVAIDRAAVLPDGDLLLDVTGARTGRARLLGRALFHNLFTSVPGARAGLDVDATWSAFGGALAVLDAPWRPRGDWTRHLEGNLRVNIHGPFDDLAARVEADGGGAHVEADLAAGLANLRFDASAVDTTWMLAPALRPMFAGRLNGSLAAWLRLAPSFRGLDAELAHADLRLDRTVAGQGPAVMVVRVGKLRREQPAARVLLGDVERVRLAGGRLDIAGARLRWTRLSGRADASIDFDGEPAGSRIEASGSLAVGSLSDWLPGREGEAGLGPGEPKRGKAWNINGLVRGHLAVSAHLVGSLERLRLDVAFATGSRVALGSQSLALPPLLALRWSERAGVSVAPFEIRAERGGVVEVSGRVTSDDQVDARLVLRDCPLASLPWISARAGSVGVTGVLAGELAMTGPATEPALSGTLSVSSLDVRGRGVGPAQASLGWRAGHARLHGRIGRSLSFTGRLRRSPRLSAEAELVVQEQPLGSWLPAPLAGAPITASGKLRLSYVAGEPPTATANLALAGPGLSAVELEASARGLLVSAKLGGQIELGAWPALWSPYLAGADGAVSVDLSVQTPLRGEVAGELVMVRDIVLRLRGRQGAVRLFAGDRVRVEGETLSSPGLRIDAPWFNGRLAGRVSLADGSGRASLSTMPLSLAVVGSIDFDRLPKLAPELSLSGRARINADLRGTLGRFGSSPGPALLGDLELYGVSLRGSSLPALTLQGTVAAQGDRLVTRGLTVDIAHTGRVTVGQGSAAWVTLPSLFPLRWGAVDVPFSGPNLRIASAPVQIRDLDVDARLRGSPGALRLTGDVAIAGGVLETSRIKGPRGASSRPWYSELPPGLSLDLHLHGPRKAMRIAVPVLPDVTVDFDCRLRADRHAASLTGSLRGDGTYDRTAVDLYAWLTDSNLRRCQLEEH